MILYTVNHTYKYECEKVCRIYFPAEKIIFACDKEILPEDSKIVVTRIIEEEEKVSFYCKALIDEREEEYSFSAFPSECEGDSLRERYLAKAIVKVLSSLTGKTAPWGILTGVRPAKLMRKYINTVGNEEAIRIFTDFLEVSREKTILAYQVAQCENMCIEMSGRNSYSLYISIPFCPTRCSYCSFVSHSVDKAKKLIPDYIKNLCTEIEATAKTAKELGLTLETVYMGGGTPTSFSAEQLDEILSSLNRSFDMTKVREFTVEAGRPDTVTKEKLQVLQKNGVSRISINPQTFSDSVLKEIGRKHTASDTEEKYLLARDMGFDNINMDLIAGLPTDTLDGFKKSLDKAISLEPENITVHTLALKRSSSIVTENETDNMSSETEDMVKYASLRLYESGYYPYYMYRQSKSLGNLENVGWCKKDKPCLYNIYMMEEIHTVLAVGGAAVTKLKAFNSDALSRVYNFKYPYEYISRFSEIIERKDEIRRFYEELR